MFRRADDVFEWEGLEISNVNKITELPHCGKLNHLGAIYPYQQLRTRRPDSPASKLEPDLKHKDVQNANNICRLVPKVTKK